jgi:hypothetical protein
MGVDTMSVNPAADAGISGLRIADGLIMPLAVSE